ncbi:dihydroxyacetone kinase subunit DhaL [Dactylosporangium sp. CA-139114]|uniref:dihydroxyacetone kinase subunit DhaL n=1 Tax=Dactylosporangium sp. CA-139114 TaxID=3239931 RepID=UPI003D98B2FC
MSVDEALAREWIAAVAESVRAEAQHLTDLDTAIGDGDHGVNLRRGFDAVTTALGGLEPASAGDVLGKTGTTLLSKVGGASGPLYGTVFRALGKTLRQGGTFAEGLRAALDGVRQLGKAEVGDKTMVDALTPAVDAYASTEADETDAARAAAAAAKAGAASTVPLVARKGRASYLGERSAGHLDPGAASTALIFEALARVTARANDR